MLLDDDVELPDQLKHLQCIKASDPECQKRIKKSIKGQLNRLESKIHQMQEKENLFWKSTVKRETCDGIPGYEVELQFLDFQSDQYPNISEIGEYIRGILLKNLFQHRKDKFTQMPDLFNYGQNKFWRTSTYRALYKDPIIVGKVISIQYDIDWYGAGAVHPNYHFLTFSFLLEPLTQIQSLEEIFREPKMALRGVRNYIREQLYNFRVGDNSQDEFANLDPDQIDKGTMDYDDFSAFVFRPNGVEILFAPYQVAAYVYGPQSVEIPYEEIASLIKNEYLNALEITPLVK